MEFAVSGNRWWVACNHPISSMYTTSMSCILYIYIPGSSKCVKFVPFHPKNIPKGRNFTYLEDPGILIRCLWTSSGDPYHPVTFSTRFTKHRLLQKPSQLNTIYSAAKTIRFQSLKIYPTFTRIGSRFPPEKE